LLRLAHILAACLFLSAFALELSSETTAAPIETIRGVIVEVGEGYLWLKPDDGSERRKFILRWKARFDPPKLPLKGDRALILFKSKEEGAVIYGVKYLGISAEP
jgi:hypothetical protein